MSTVYDEKLLDKVGLAMVPSGYTNNVADVDNLGGALGKVYSVLPIQTIGDNVVTNGTFDVDANWTKGTGWDIIGGKAVCDGTQTNVTNLSSNTGETTLAGGTYKITYTITRTNGTVRVNLGNWGEYRSSDGTYTDTIQDTNGGSRIVVQGNADFVGSVDNISVQLVSDGDFDFSRGSDATRVNSQGYIESVQVLSGELVQNGDFEDISETEEVTNGGFDTDSDWTLTSGWSISNGTINADNATSIAYQNIGVTNGKVYKVTYEVSNYVSGIFKIQLNGTTNVFGQEVSSNGTYTDYLKGNSTSNGNFSLSRSTNFTGSIDNVSVKEVGENWTFGTGWSIEDDGGDLKATKSGSDLSYLTHNILNSVSGKKYRTSFDVTGFTTGNFRVESVGDSVTQNPQDDYTYALDHEATVSGDFRILGWNGFDGSIDNISVVEVTDDTDIPRLDYTNAACPSLLLEPQRINYILQSEDLNSITIKTGGYSITNNEATSPEGKNNASELEIISTGQQYIGRSFTLAGNRVISAFVKYNNSATRFYLGSFTTTHDVANAVFDIENGTILSETTGSTNNKILEEAIIEDYGSGWYRCAVHISGTSGVTAYGISDTDTADLIPQLSTTGINLYAWGLQAEQGSYPTSYIPTNGELVTRRADICNNAGDSTIFNDSEGVLYAEVAALSNTAESSKFITISDGTYNNRASILFSNGATNQIRTFLRVGGVGQIDENNSVSNSTEFNKVAFSYKENDFKVYVNGSLLSSSTNGSVWPTNTITKLSFSEINTSSGLFNGKTRSLLYFNEALSNAELEYITSADIDLTIHNYKGSLSKISATYEDVGVKDRLTKLF